MRPQGVRQLLKAEPFRPIRVCLSDGRSIIIRHPDQAVVSERMLFVGLTKVERSRPLATPRSGDAIAKDWMLVNLLQISAVEPDNGKDENGRRLPKS